MNRPVVLLVDDEPNIRETLSFILEMEGFAVETAANGKEGLERIYALKPPVVLLDAMMPIIDGFEVCRTVKGDKSLAGTLIIMLTALGQRTDQDRAFSVGADYFVKKPFDEEELLALLRTLTSG